METKELDWKIKIGTSVKWITHAPGGNKETVGTVIDYCPANIQLSSLVGFDVPKTIKDVSMFDRYVVEIKKAKKSTSTKLKFPLKSVLEKCN